MQIEYVARICFTSRRTAEQKGHRTISYGVLGEVIIYNEDVFALVHEIFTDSYTGVRCKILHRGSFGCAGMYDNGIIHRTCRFQAFIYADNVRIFLSDGYINTNNILSFLVQNGIDSNGSFTGTAVTDDKFTLSASDRNHRVDTFQTGLQRYADRLSVGNTCRFHFNVAVFVCLDVAVTVNRLSQRIDYAADNRIAYRNLHEAACSFYRVAFLNGFGIPQKNRTYVAFFQVHSHAVNAIGQFEQFTGHTIFQAVDMGDTVADFKNRTYFIDIEVYFVVFNLFFNDRCNFI